MRCKGMKKGPVRKKGVIVPNSDRVKNCGRTATVFFRISYSKLFAYADNGMYEDVIGFCEECSSGKDVPSGYVRGTWDHRKILHLRGDVCQVEPCDGTMVRDDVHNRRMHDGKRELLKIMSYKGNADLMDDWVEIMDLAIKEFQVREVMSK